MTNIKIVFEIALYAVIVLMIQITCASADWNSGDAMIREYIPGHSKGSIGILTAGGDLFCGDLLMNEDKPGLNYNMDDPAAANVKNNKG